MQIKLTCRHTRLSEALRTYIESRLEKLGSHLNGIIEAHAVLSVEKYRHLAEITIVANGLTIHAKQETEDMYASVDAVIEKLERQITKYKTRINRHQPRKARHAHRVGLKIIEPDDVWESSQPEPEHQHRVVDRRSFPTKPMTIDEALMQLDLIESDFLVFTNAQTDQVNVLHTREDRKYELIEPET